MARPKRKRDDQSKLEARIASQIVLASDLPAYFRALFYGRTGSGKTRLASSAPKVLLVDVNEEGTASVRNDYNPHVFQVKYWGELSDVEWYLRHGDHDFETVGIDGLTAMQDLAMKFVLGDESSRDASRDPDMPDRRVWGKVGELMKTQITNFRNLPMNVIFTALDRKRVIGDEDDEEQEITTGPALSPAVAGAAERAVGMIGYLHKQQIVVKGKRIRKGGKVVRTKSTRTVRRRLLVDDPTERYQTKNRYFHGAEYVDAPDVTEMIEMIYGKEAE